MKNTYQLTTRSFVLCQSNGKWNKWLITTVFPLRSFCQIRAFLFNINLSTVMRVKPGEWFWTWRFLEHCYLECRIPNISQTHTMVTADFIEPTQICPAFGHEGSDWWSFVGYNMPISMVINQSPHITKLVVELLCKAFIYLTI